MADQVGTQQEPIQVNVDPNVAFNLKLQEFDKLIAESEAQTAEIKRQKATFIYESNVNIILQQKQAQDQAAAASETQVVDTASAQG
jgi:hypothetical protein